MTRPRDYLTGELTKKLRRYRVVVWDDRDRRYADVAREVTPAEASFAVYDGSWFALRREIEPLLSQAEPSPIVVYVPATRPDQDPLEEARQAGTSWSITLEHLLGKALAGELTDTRIKALARRARTLTEAEAGLDGAAVDPRLVSAFRSADPVEIALHLLSGDKDRAVTEGDAWHQVAEALATEFGARLPREAAHLRPALFRHVGLTAIHHALGGLPEPLESGVEVTASQVASCLRLLDRLKDPRRIDLARALGEAFDAEVHASAAFSWDDRLGGIDVSPAFEELAIAEALRHLAAGDPERAQRLAEQRLRESLWAQPYPGKDKLLGPDHPYRRWKAIDGVARLQDLAARRLSPAGDAAGTLDWYAQEGWEVDRAHRLAELARADLGHAGRLDEHYTLARQAYEGWLERVVSQTTAAVVEGGLDPGTLLPQGEVFARVVGTTPGHAAGPTAYVLVDALRFELGAALAERLGGARQAAPPCLAALAAVPTITPVGMANLLPDAQDGLSLTLDGDALVPVVAGTPVRDATERVGLLRREVGALLDLRLTELMNRSDERLRTELADVDLVVVRSTDIDDAGESGRAGTAWRNVDGILDDLANQILRLGRLGVGRVVVTADHGFIVLSDSLASGHVLERPGGTGELHRRCWVGRGGVTPPGACRLALAALGVGGGLDLVVPKGLAVFPLPGTRQFFHGGLSPQELVVPVISMDLTPPEAAVVEPAVAISIAGKGITTGVFAVTLTFTGSVFASEVTVRVLARTLAGTTPAARLVAGDGYDEQSGTVTVTIEPAVLTFQVTANLERSTPVELHVLDAASGAELATARVPVAVPVTVEEDW